MTEGRKIEKIFSWKLMKRFLLKDVID